MLVALGTPLFDNLDLEAVAAEADRQGRWEFMLVAAPLVVEGGTGVASQSPCNLLTACSCLIQEVEPMIRSAMGREERAGD
jgi:hypothetical protein